MGKSCFRTVRCIIRQGDKFLLVVHRGARKGAPRRWTLPGGRIENGEDFETTARREIREELRIPLEALREVGNYRYKGSVHKVLGTEHDAPIIIFDRAELLKIGWHTLDEVVAFAEKGMLHSGFEAAAIRDFVALVRS